MSKTIGAKKFYRNLGKFKTKEFNPIFEGIANLLPRAKREVTKKMVN